jgi:DNA-binding CsgD family transcriptional regulator
MDRLAGGDYRRILAFLDVALAADGRDPFPAPVLEALQRLISSDTVSYGDHAGRGLRSGLRVWPDVRVPRTVAAAFIRLRDQDPLRPTDRTVGRAVRQSDLISDRQLHRLDFYAEVAEPLGIEYSMQLWLADGGRVVGGFGFDANRRDFSERERAMLDVLAPYLVKLHRRAAAPRLLGGETGAMAALTVREREVLRLVAAGLTNPEIATTLFIATGTVRKHLDNVYERFGVGSRAAAVAVALGGAEAGI